MTQPRTGESELRTTTLVTSGMSCEACVRHVVNALDGMTGVVHVDVNLQKNEATVEHLPAHVDAIALAAAVRDAGYPTRVAETVADTNRFALQPEQSVSCRCGCCWPSKERQTRADLGTSTIG